MEKINSIQDFLQWNKRLKENFDPKKKTVMICGGTGCTALGSTGVYDAFQKEIRNRNLQEQILLKRTGCHGFCEKGPVLIILPEQFFYPAVEPEHVPRILETTVLGGKVIESLLYVDPLSGKKISYEYEIPFYAKQQRHVFRNNGRIDPIDIEDYIRCDGYVTLANTLKDYSPQQVIDIVIEAGLRGRGGGGFPTGLKWKLCRESDGDEKYLICNADEGDPGAFMDRSLLEGTPHAILEGMLIAAYAIGASHGFIYVRAEYPLAVEHVNIALEQARAAGLLGKKIAGSDFNFDIQVRMGAGAFVCGEETALIASLEGKRGMPNARPPFPAQKRLYGQTDKYQQCRDVCECPA